MSKKILILGIAALLVMGSMQVGGSGAMFSDTETSTGNTITAWAWQQADDLVVDESGARLTPPGRKLYGMTIENDPENSPETSGAYDITIAEIILSWDPNEGENIRLVRIWFEGGVEWHGTEGSGAKLDIEDCTLSPGEKRYIAFTFDGDMSGKGFAIEFIMGDGSTKTVSFGPVAIAEEGAVTYEETAPDEEATPDPTLTSEPTPTLEPTLTPTPTSTPEPTPTPTLTR